MEKKYNTREEFIIDLLDRGFLKSAQSFSKLIDLPVTISDKHSVSIQLDDKHLDIYLGSGVLYALSTEFLGELNGESFLIFTQREVEFFFKGINSGNLKHTEEEFKHSMLTEIANVISAATIAELASGLNIEVYGDVPVIQKLNGYSLQQRITAHRTDDFKSAIVLSNHFTIDLDIPIHPVFLWKLDSLIFEKVPNSKIAIS